MAESKHRRKGRSRLPAVIRVGDRTAEVSSEFRRHDPGPGVVTPSEREIRDAIASIPDDLDWAWARGRIAPVFERPGAGSLNGDPILHGVSELGVAFAFAIEVGPLFTPVTASMAERWEASLEQIEAAAFDHLQAAVAPITRKQVQHAVHRGHLIRFLPEPGGWASSVILAGVDEVTRIFGPQDQIFTVPSRNGLMSFSAGTPGGTVLDVTLGMEEMDLHPLELEPFVLENGRLSWTGVIDDEDLSAGR
jgi:hypothetical protein